MSIYNAAGTVSSELGAGLTYMLRVTESDYTNLSLLVAICALSSLLPLPFIGVLDRGGGKEPHVVDSETDDDATAKLL